MCWEPIGLEAISEAEGIFAQLSPVGEDLISQGGFFHLDPEWVVMSKGSELFSLLLNPYILPWGGFPERQSGNQDNRAFGL